MKLNNLFVRLSLLVGFVVVSQIAQINAGQYFQDFSSFSNGATNFNDRSQLFSTALGSAASVSDPTYTELQLTAYSVTNTRTAFLLPELDPGAPIYAFSAKWNSQMYAGFPNAGEGFSLSFGQLGATNLLYSTTQEAGYDSGIAFSVQTSTTNAPGFYVRVNGATVASVTNNPTATWGSFNITRHFFEVDWNYTNGLSAKMDGQRIFTNVATTNFTSQVGDRFVWAARTGTSTEEMRLDNIVVVTGGNLVQVPTTNAYFGDANTTQGVTNAFDNNNSTSWATSTNGGYVGATVSSPAKVVAYALTSGNVRMSDPQSWTLQGSNDGGATWTNVSNGAGHFLISAETRAHLATNFVSYNAYRLNIVTNHNDPQTILAELRLYEVRHVSPTSVPWNTPGLDSGGSDGWPHVSSSADGKTMVAVNYWGIYLSKDYGETWGGNFASGFGDPVNWNCVSLSGDATQLLIGIDGGSIYRVTFYPQFSSHEYNTSDAPNASWYGIALSADGTRAAAVAMNGGIYTSTNSGAHWVQTSAPTNTWWSIASSADGRVLAATTYGDRTYVSTDFGATWTRRNSPNYCFSVAMSADGAKIVVGGLPAVAMSSNFGVNWSNTSSSGSLPASDWFSVASSAEGTRLVAVNSDGAIYTSINSGSAWQLELNIPGLEWDGVASSADGTKLVAGSIGALSTVGSLYTWHYPILHSQLSDTNFAISWTTNQTGFGLQQNSDLNTPNWVTVTNSVTLGNGQYQLNLPRSGSKGFFRLSAP